MALKEFIFTYDLVGEKSDKEFLADLRDKDAIHVQKSVWYLTGAYTCSDSRDHFKTLVGSNDRLLLVLITDWASRKLIAKIPNE